MAGNPNPVAGFDKNPQNINRDGRPKGISITEMVRTALEEVEPKTGKQWKDLIIKRILLKATNEGDTQMLKAIWAYIDGMPKQSTTNINVEVEENESLNPEEKLQDVLKRIKELQGVNN